MPKLDINQALTFLDLLDPGGRHTIASEAPFGGRDREPKWEGGATFEARQRQYLVEDIQARQARGSNVYYGVNRPCPVWEQEGRNGKCTARDIIAIRALAFDIDFTVKKDPELAKALLAFIDARLIGALRPSLVIDSGGGIQLIYLLRQIVDVRSNPNERRAVTDLANDFEELLRSQIPSSLRVKIDNMSNVDRVMRLPGSVNFPKAEKIEKGQTEALAHIVVNYNRKCDLPALREQAPQAPKVQVAPPSQPKRPYVQRANDPWTPYAKAKFCCEYVRDCGLADTNGWYTLNVMFPLIGEAIAGNFTMDEAEELFLEAVSGGERYGGQGRGERYFRRQWRSHLHSSRNGQRTLGSLVTACKANGMPTPWKDTVFWQKSYEEQLEAIKKITQTVDADILEMLKTAT